MVKRWKSFVLFSLFLMSRESSSAILYGVYSGQMAADEQSLKKWFKKPNGMSSFGDLGSFF
jgi:hypothetical protein